MLSDEISNVAGKGASMMGAVLGGLARGLVWGAGIALAVGAAWFLFPAIFGALTAGGFGAAGTALMGGTALAAHGTMAATLAAHGIGTGLASFGTGLIGMTHAALGVGSLTPIATSGAGFATIMSHGIGHALFTGAVWGAGVLGVTSVIPGISSGFGLRNLIPHRQPQEAPANQPLIAPARTRTPAPAREVAVNNYVSSEPAAETLAPRTVVFNNEDAKGGHCDAVLAKRSGQETTEPAASQAAPTEQGPDAGGSNYRRTVVAERSSTAAAGVVA